MQFNCRILKQELAEDLDIADTRYVATVIEGAPRQMVFEFVFVYLILEGSCVLDGKTWSSLGRHCMRRRTFVRRIGVLIEAGQTTRTDFSV